MELKHITAKLQGAARRYKYALVVLALGVVLLLIPGRNSQDKAAEEIPAPLTSSLGIDPDELADILQNIQGVGKVKVLLSTTSGEKTIYQMDVDITSTGEKQQTVIVSDSARSESGLVSQINPPIYRGAIIVCQGAGSPSVRLAVTQAVSKITGLGADQICVLTMK